MKARVTVVGGRQYEFERGEHGVLFSSVDELGRVDTRNLAILATLPRLKPGTPMVVGFVTGVVGNFGVVEGVRYSL